MPDFDSSYPPGTTEDDVNVWWADADDEEDQRERDEYALDAGSEEEL